MATLDKLFLAEENATAEVRTAHHAQDSGRIKIVGSIRKEKLYLADNKTLTADGWMTSPIPRRLRPVFGRVSSCRPGTGGVG